MENLDGAELHIRRWCTDYVAKTLELPADRIDPQREFARLGMDSAMSVLFLVELEHWLGVELASESCSIIQRSPNWRGMWSRQPRKLRWRVSDKCSSPIRSRRRRLTCSVIGRPGQPDKPPYVFLAEQGRRRGVADFSELDQRVSIAAGQIARQTQPGDRALLLFHAGLDFVMAFLGCLRAGVIAVPMMVPRRASSRDSSAAILADCAPRLVITNVALCLSRPDVIENLGSPFEFLMLDRASALGRPVSPTHPRSEIGFCSTRPDRPYAPKGVMVAHRI